MMGPVLIIAIVIATTDFSCANLEELRLREIFRERGFSDRLRPVKHHYTTTHVKMAIDFRSIDDLDEKKQLLSTSSWLRLYWDSEVHTWDPKDFGNLKEIFYYPDEFWVPDVVLYNSGSGDALFSAIKTPISVTYDGNVTWKSPLTAHSSCRLDISYYPFDNQRCSFIFGLWSKDGSVVNISLVYEDYHPDLTRYQRSGTFNLMGLETKRNDVTYIMNGRPTVVPNVEFVMFLQRRSKWYEKGIVAPSMLLGALAVITFVLPAACGERVGYCVTLLLTLMVLLLTISEQIPETSDSYPIISLFLELMLLSLTAALLVSSITLKLLFHQTESVEEISWFIRVFTNKWLAVLTFVDGVCSIRCKKRVTRDLEVVRLTNSQTASSKKLNNALERIVKHLDEMNATEECDKEYVKAAKIWDRICILLYLGMMAGTYMWLNLSAPIYSTA